MGEFVLKGISFFTRNPMNLTNWEQVVMETVLISKKMACAVWRGNHIVTDVCPEERGI